MSLTVPENYYDKSIDITFFVACYNEEAGIISAIKSTLAAAAKAKCTFEIIVIDDGSTDRSVELVKEFQAKNPELPLYLKVNEVNRGLAQNYIEGAFLGRGKYYRLICGDDPEPADSIAKILSYLGKADIIIPYHAKIDGKSAFRLLLSNTYTNLINMISGFNIRYYNGLPIHLRYHVMRWHTNYRGFGFQADMVTRILENGGTYIEVPVSVHERSGGKSHALNLINFLSVSHTIFDIFVRRVGTVLREKKKAAKRKNSQSAHA